MGLLAPASVKTPGGIAKGLFKKAMEPYLPELLSTQDGLRVPDRPLARSDLKDGARCAAVRSSRRAWHREA